MCKEKPPGSRIHSHLRGKLSVVCSVQKNTPLHLLLLLHRLLLHHLLLPASHCDEVKHCCRTAGGLCSEMCQSSNPSTLYSVLFFFFLSAWGIMGKASVLCKRRISAVIDINPLYAMFTPDTLCLHLLPPVHLRSSIIFIQGSPSILISARCLFPYLTPRLSPSPVHTSVHTSVRPSVRLCATAADGGHY